MTITSSESIRKNEATDHDIVDPEWLMEGDLLRSASKGDTLAWAELVRRFGPMVRRVALRSGLDDSDAADVAQVTWIRLWQSIDQVRDPDRVAGWLATTARRESIRVSIQNSRCVTCADPLDEQSAVHKSGPGTDDGFDSVSSEPAIETALSRLPTQYQRLLALLTSDARLSYVDVGRILGIPVGSIGPMRLRALKQLRGTPEMLAWHERHARLRTPWS